MGKDKFLDEEREEMPVYDESIFYPVIERRKLGLTDENMECIVEFFRWHIQQRNRRIDRQRIITILKLRAEQLINQKKVLLRLFDNFELNTSSSLFCQLQLVFEFTRDFKLLKN